MKSKEVKKVQAISRQLSSNERTPKQRLARLDECLGKGVGAARERAKLEKLIAAEEEKLKAEQKKAAKKDKK